jgi:hypothetical protein
MYFYYNSPRFDFGLKLETNSLNFYGGRVNNWKIGGLEG